MIYFSPVEENSIPRLAFSQHVKKMHSDGDKEFEFEYQVMLQYKMYYQHQYIIFISMS